MTPTRRKPHRLVTGAIILALTIVPAAHATHIEPAKASKGAFALVNGFFECGSPNTAMQSNGMAACAPPTMGDPCAFTSTGAGKLSFTKVGSVTAGTQDLQIVAVASELNASCENLPLHVRLAIRVTSDDCPEGTCTATDQKLDLIGASCTVANGKCKIKTTLNTAAPGTIPSGKNAGIQVFECGLKSPFLLPSDPEFACGLLLK